MQWQSHSSKIVYFRYANKVSNSVQRNFGIDLLRGFSILLVIVHHMALNFRLPLGPSLVGDFLSKRIINGISFNGYESVFMFFVLSGFLIAQRCLQSYGSLYEINWRVFYIQRFSRIFPLLALLLLVLSSLHVLGVSGYVISEKRQTLGGALFSALALHLNWYEGQTTWLPASWDVLWSLSIEETFYLAFPIICLLLPQRWLILALLILAFSLPWVRDAIVGNEIWQEKAYLPGMSAIAFGVLTAMLAQRWTTSNSFAYSMAAFGGIGLVAIYFFGSELWRTIGMYHLLVLCLSACFLVFSAHRIAPKPRRGLRWLALMGRLSYELYLSHMFVVLGASAIYRAYFGENLYWTFLLYIPAVLICIGLAALLERYVSTPAMIYLRSAAIGQKTA
jgi:peptidoglycan/LPS O-acetylase OafA/YrhL